MKTNFKNLMFALPLFIFGFLVFSFEKSHAFIGGDLPREYRPGIVKIGSGHLLGTCTGTMVSPRHLLTATHCITSTNILNYGITTMFPVVDFIEILDENGNLNQEEVNIKAVHLYPIYYFNGNSKQFAGMSDEDAFGPIVEIGDIAIVELSDGIRGLTSFPKILFQRSQSGNSIWIGGFGINGIDNDNKTYTGVYAQAGQLRNVIDNSESSTTGTRKETNVSVEILDLGQNITYLGRGDSGGGVFAKINNNNYVVAVNHAGYFGRGNGLKLDKSTGQVMERPQAEGSEVIGFAHFFLTSNTKLLQWVSGIIPKSQIVIQR